MRRTRRHRRERAKPTFTISQVLAYADAFHERTGRWPNLYSGAVWGCRGENWRKIDSALRLGLRGLPGGSSLARLLAEQRGVRNSTCLPRLGIQQILSYADAYRDRTGEWPKEISGTIPEAPGETWHAVDRALRAGVRGFAGGSSLARLLAGHRKVRNIQALPRLTVKQILAWVDAHYKRTGTWPTTDSGPIPRAPGETWSGVNAALHAGRRGFPGGSSLARLLARNRGVRNPKAPPPLTLDKILRWAREHYRRTGDWPSWNSGPIPQAPGETWAMVNRALRKGQRGLQEYCSLFRLLRRCHPPQSVDGAARR
jgi:hypothetical protein